MRWRFVRHYVEMVIAMLVGMMLLAPLWHPIAHWLDWPELLTQPDLHTLVMATDMTIGMTAWMRYRGHGWRPIAEMAAAMYVPFLLLFPFLWLDLISGETLMTLGHTLMLLAMLGVMLARPQEYSHSHRPSEHTDAPRNRPASRDTVARWKRTEPDA